MSESLNNVEELIPVIIELYEGITQNLSGNKKYKLKIDDKKFTQLQKFAEFFIEKVGVVTVGSMKEYLMFAFGKYSGRKGYYGGKNCFTMKWIVSTNLLKEFKKCNGKIKWVNNRKLSENSKLKRVIKTIKQKSNDSTAKKNMLLSLSNFEEDEKRKFLNTKKGFHWCIDFTTLYNPMSNNCQKCQFNVRCKNLLKENYPNVFKVRIDE